MSIDFCRLPAITVMPVIRVRPIISAEAVAAVRRGLRTEFWRASLPETPKTRRTGAAAAISGRDSSGVRTNTPMISRTAPRPMGAWPSEPDIVVAARTTATPAAENSAPSVLRSTSDLVVACACTLLIAATGGIFAARRPGSQAASMVTRTPTARAARTVPGVMTRGPSGTVAPSVPISDRSPAPMPTPAARPVTAATTPTTNASMRTERVTCRREAPTARSRASSLVRWATSMVKVLAMMNVPTKSAMPAKTSSPCFRPDIEAEIASAWLSASSCPVVVSTVSFGRALSSSAFSADWLTPAFALTSIWSYVPGLPNSCWAAAVSKRARLPPAATLPSSVLKMPVIFGSRTGPSTDSRTVSPTSYPARFAVCESMRTSPSPLGACPLTSGYRGSSAPQ